MSASPLPLGTKFGCFSGAGVGRLVASFGGAVWLHALSDGRRALVALADDERTTLQVVPADVRTDRFEFAGVAYRCLVSAGDLAEVGMSGPCSDVAEAERFADGLSQLECDPSWLLHSAQDGLIASLLVCDETGIPRAMALGRYLTGGVDVSAEDLVALDRLVPRIEIDDLERIVAASGAAVKSAHRAKPRSKSRKTPKSATTAGPFVLPGREALAEFFNEHVVDIVANEARYAALGISFPGGIILEGPTGCGKTFAVERLVEHLGWRSFSIDASSVASPYIHETSRKVAEVFSEAIKAAPAVIVIDEMDAFLADRDVGTGHHRVEEVAEFLRRIPEAAAARVLVIGMTNKIDMIDPAILRRGRFDHVIHVDHAGAEEVKGLLGTLLKDIPNELEDTASFAAKLAGRPLSDVAFVVREAGRLAARAGREVIGTGDFAAALAKTPSRQTEDHARIGF